MNLRSTDKPQFTHDCDRCVFLGRHNCSDCDYDLYCCSDTVIARYGNEGHQYSSGLPFSYGMSQPLTEARLRAEALGVDFDAVVQQKRDKFL